MEVLNYNRNDLHLLQGIKAIAHKQNYLFSEKMMVVNQDFESW